MKIIVDGEVFEAQTEYDFTTDTLTVLSIRPETSFPEVSLDHKKFAEMMKVATHKEERWDEF